MRPSISTRRNIPSSRRPRRARRGCGALSTSRRFHHERASGGAGGRDPGARCSQATWSAAPERASGATMTADIRRDDAFPRLTPEQLARLRPLGRERRVADGGVLVEQGATDLPFYVVLEGSIAIVLPSPMGEHIVVVHEQAQFAGDVDTLSGHRAIVTGRARGAGVVLEIERARLVALVQLDAELSEILLRAFIMRRAFLLPQGRGDLVVIGSRYCASTLRLREFLTRNGLPHAYIDVELERNVQAVLENFKVGVDDIPV